MTAGVSSKAIRDRMSSHPPHVASTEHVMSCNGKQVVGTILITEAASILPVLTRSQMSNCRWGDYQKPTDSLFQRREDSRPGELSSALTGTSHYQQL